MVSMNDFFLYIGQSTECLEKSDFDIDRFGLPPTYQSGGSSGLKSGH